MQAGTPGGKVCVPVCVRVGWGAVCGLCVFMGGLYRVSLSLCNFGSSWGYV